MAHTVTHDQDHGTNAVLTAVLVVLLAAVIIGAIYFASQGFGEGASDINVSLPESVDVGGNE